MLFVKRFAALLGGQVVQKLSWHLQNRTIQVQSVSIRFVPKVNWDANIFLLCLENRMKLNFEKRTWMKMKNKRIEKGNRVKYFSYRNSERPYIVTNVVITRRLKKFDWQRLLN